MTDLHARIAALSPERRRLLERRFAPAPAASAIPRIADGLAPVSAEQRRLWYLLQLAPGYPIYTIPLGFRLTGALDADALAAALTDLVARHETLRTAVRESAGEPVQAVGDGAAFTMETVDLRGDEWAEAEASYQTDAFARRTYAVSKGEVFRARLLRVADDDHRLLLGVHHLAADGWSAATLLRELSALYAARIEGGEAELPAPAVRYRDWAAWQQRPDAPPMAKEEAFWRAELACAPTVLDLPNDRARPPVQGWDGAKHTFSLSDRLSARLRDLARREGATLYAVLAAAYALLLHRYAGEDDLLVGTILANRPRPELEGVVGLFAGILPLRVRIPGDVPVGEMVRRVHRAALGLHEHAALPFDRIVEIAGARRDFGRPPLVQAVLVFTDAPSAALSLPGIAVETLHPDSGTAIFELTLLVEDGGGALSAAFQHSTQLFDPPTVRRMADHFTALLAGMAADPDAPVSALSLATEVEAESADAFSRAGPALLRGECIHRLFRRQARATPDTTAIVHAGERVTYGELDARSDRIARALRARGVGPEARVGVCMARTPLLPATLLGVLKAGAAYVPLDPAHPVSRKEAAIRLSRAALVVADESSRERLSSAAASVVDAAELDLAAMDDLEVDAGKLDDSASPENLAYVIFTSGSTGGPKGVEIEHRSAAAMLGWMRATVADEERAGVLASTSVTFDVSVAELFGTLCWGGTLVMVENALDAPPAGVPVLAAAMTPTAAAELLREHRFPPGVRTVLLGGEAVPPVLATALHGLPSVERVLNLYGPTEDTTYTTCAALEPGEERVPVGRPIAGGRVYVLDSAFRHAGIGAPGEVCTAGAGVARGYASRPALTAERFVPDPHGPPGARMYRTLDRGRWRPDGALEYLGRADAQVKVRGHRIELEEAELALSAHPAVRAAAVAVCEDAGGRRLVGYVVAHDGGSADRVPAPGPTDAAVSSADPSSAAGGWVDGAAGEVDDRTTDARAKPSAAELRGFLRERLPEYMVPGAFVWLPALPRTTSGKLDRRALPDPQTVAGGDDGAGYVAPRDALEERVAALWREVLGVERVGVHDDFFDLGGQSILATRLVARVRTELGLEVGVAELLQDPTLEAMARAVSGRRHAVRLPLVPLQTFGDRPPLFLSHPAGGHVVCYRGLAVLLAGEQPVYALQPRGVEDGRTPYDTIDEMSAHYVAAIRAMRPRGPYRLGGWSFGGVVAWEMAQQLHAAGEAVDLLALFDTAPLTPDMVSLDHGDPAEVVWHTVAGLAGYAAASRVDVATLRGLEPRAQALAMIRGLDLPHLLPESRVDDVLALTTVRAANLRAQTSYVARPYVGRLTYIRTAGSETAPGLSPGLAFWSALALGGTASHRVDGSHGTILQEPHVQNVAAALLADGAKG
ncbi:MAG: Amino acid adenylation protein [Gemmatimonadetes bacterium]|nr:Amino acid adenylation protein [Gemmatimonadota bacterium]